MIKEVKSVFFKAPVFLRTLILVVVVFLINLGAFVYRYINMSITGFTIRESLYGAYQTPLMTKIFLIAEWTLLISGLLFVYIKERKSKINEDELSGINLKKLSKKKGTDLDTFYSVLQTKKQLRISTIAKLFEIDKQNAMEWCKILESGNLAYLDYPTAREPVVKLNED
jgi:hypothetical protein